MALEAYRKKRDFAATPEPKGKRQRKSGNSFVIQKHAATRLHYDFRLEMDGVLKSWAVTKGPSLVPGEKRLAVHVEDHPLEYGDFEGTIPKGEYGGGTVIVWDMGTWVSPGDARKAYAKGHLEFELHGKRLAGRWHLVRMRGKPKEKHENWLLIKGEDDAARSAKDPDILVEEPTSVKTGRELTEVAGEEPGWSSKTGKIVNRKTKGLSKKRVVKNKTGSGIAVNLSDIKGAEKEGLPKFIEPMLATLAQAPPSGQRWLHEIKFDGYRLQARLEAGRVKLLTRSGLDWTKKFGKEIIGALQILPLGMALLDGELVVENENGASDFSALQADLAEGKSDRFILYVFDLLHLDGVSLRNAHLVDRKNILKQIVGDSARVLRYSDHFEEDGDLVLQHACRLSLEGVISKSRDAPYRSGRGKSWFKSKCSSRQEFVVAGFVPSTVSRRAVGSIVLGVYENSRLQHVGRVGTGFTEKTAEDLFRRLERIQSQQSPFSSRLSTEEARGVRYVRPDLVAEVEFRAWTGDGHLRHASFRGLREDKLAKDVERESVGGKTSVADRVVKPQVKLTHSDRLYWPDEGITKEGLADYYTDIWRFVAPFIVGRPLALLRCPTGINGQQFFQKHAWKGLSHNIVLINDPKDPDQPLISINDLPGLIGLVQAAVLEIHPWGSTVTDWERPDTIIMDLDPGDGVSWASVVRAAKETRERLKHAGLSSFVKTSGGKGLHIVSPLDPGANWPAVKEFTKSMAEAMASDSPDRYVATISKSKRRGKILIDYLRNQRGATAVAPYSTRARPGASVSMPLDWSELDSGIGSSYFTVQNAPTRLASMKSDPWRDFRQAARPLEEHPETKPRRLRKA